MHIPAMPNVSRQSMLLFLINSLTASGAVIALMGLEAVYERQWETAFIWLGLALVIDAIDGPIARSFKVQSDQRFSGGRLDLIVDYLNYVFVPAVALVKSGMLPVHQSLFMASVILLTSLYHFSDTRSKAEDHSFTGFPAIWNVVIFYLFIFQPSKPGAAIVILIFAALTFMPLRWAHPVRNRKLRPLTLLVTALGAAASIWIVSVGFDAEAPVARIILAVAALYGFCLVALNGTLWRGDERNGNPAGNAGK